MAEGAAAIRSPFGQPGLVGLLIVVFGLLFLEASYGLCSQDDAYISFRYAQNAAAGLGLVYNPGELVEGYTNFLWTVLFIPTELIGLDPGPVSTVYGYILSFTLLTAIWRMCGRDWRPVALVACFPGLALEAVQGLETVLYATLVTLALAGGRLWWGWAGLAALTRPEGYAVFGLLWLFRRQPIALIGFLSLTLPHLAFRLVYYGDIVPNTFHAKVGAGEGVANGAVLRGLRYLGEGVSGAVPLFVAAAMGLALRLLQPPRAPGAAPAAPPPGAGRADAPPFAEAATLTVFFFGYIALVGGDFKGTGRFLIPLLGPLGLLASAGLRRLPPVGRLTVVSVGLAWAVPGWRDMADFADRFSSELTLRRAIGERLAEVTPPGTTLAVHAAGILPYYAGLPTIDMWGLNDAHIAKAPVQEMGKGIAGHERADYAYVFARRPTVILPEVDLYTEQRVSLDDPGVFGPAFAEVYAPISVPLDGGFINGWALRPPGSGAPPVDAAAPAEGAALPSEGAARPAEVAAPPAEGAAPPAEGAAPPAEGAAPPAEGAAPPAPSPAP